MTDTALALVPEWGVALIFVATLLSCLALPVPSSLLMLGGGAFAASGDLSLTYVLVGAFAGAVIGDNIGYFLGDRLNTWAPQWLGSDLGKRADETLNKRGAVAVFLSRWLFSPLGPYVNFLAGGTGLGWSKVLIAETTGEMVWVGLYVGLGYVFLDQIPLIANLLGDFLGLLSAALVAGILARELLRRVK